MFKMQTYLG